MILPETSDPTAIILSAGAACITGLSSILLAIVFANNKGIREELRSLRQSITGDGGLTVGLVTRLATLEGRMQNAESVIEGLQRSTLTKEIFEREIQAQNETLSELKGDSKAIASRVERLDRSMAARPWSQTTMPAVRPTHSDPREEPSDPPEPPRPRAPSRPR